METILSKKIYFFSIQQDKKIEFADLNEDCIRLIFDRLDLADLINIAAINPSVAYIATGIYRQKYLNYEIKVDEAKPEQNEKRCLVQKSRNLITIRDLEVFSNIMNIIFEIIFKK